MMFRFPAARVLAALVTFSAALFVGTDVRATEFRVTEGAEGNLVKFESKAPMESFDGKTSAVSGLLSFDPAAIGETIGVTVDVKMATLDTGVKMRNQHMRENHLQTEKYPTSSFRGAKVVKGAGGSLSEGKPLPLVLEGDFTLHGVTKSIQIPATLALVAGASGAPLRVRLDATFSVELGDYEIPRPQMLFMKLSETQKVVVTLVSEPGTASATTEAEVSKAIEVETAAPDTAQAPR